MHSQVSRASAEAVQRIKNATSIAPVFMLHLTRTTRHFSQHGTCKKKLHCVQRKRHNWNLLATSHNMAPAKKDTLCSEKETQLESPMFNETSYAHDTSALMWFEFYLTSVYVNQLHLLMFPTGSNAQSCKLNT